MPEADADYHKLPANGDEAKNGEHDETEEKKPWGRLAVMLVCCGISSGLCPGATVWVQMLTTIGIYSHLCPYTDASLDKGDYVPCDNQFLVMGSVFTACKLLSIMIGVLAGVLFDRFGGRNVGTLGGITVMVGFCLLQICIFGAMWGMDHITSYLFFPTVIIIDCGSVFSSQGVLAILFHFADIGAVIYSLLGATIYASALLPVLMQTIMHMLNVNLPTGLFGWIAVSGIATSSFFMVCPSQTEYLDQAEKVLGQKLGSRNVSVIKILWDANRLMGMNWKDHAFFLVTQAVAGIWPPIYMGVAGDYATKLFGYPAAASKLASIMVLATCIVGIFTMPFASYLGEVFGIKYLLLSMALAFMTCWWSLIQADWFAQTYTCVMVSYCNGIGAVMFGLRAMAFAPATKVGTVGGMSGCYFAILSIPLNIVAQIWMATLPDDHRFTTAFTLFGGFSAFTMTLYIVIFWLFLPLPSSPVLLPEEEEDICKSYGCKMIADVAYILHHEEEKSMRDVRAKLSTTDKDVHETLVMCIDHERMAQKMDTLSVKDLGSAINTGLVWSKDLSKVDFNNNIFGMNAGGNAMKGFLKNVADVSKFGKGGAKTVEQLEAEMKSGRSQFVVGANGKPMREVKLVALRIYNNRTPQRSVLVQVGETLEDGRERSKMQWPGTKRGPNETLERCASKILNKIGMDKVRMDFDYSSPQVDTKERESESYPGCFTVYNRSSLCGYVVDTSPLALRSVGLPDCTPFKCVSSTGQSYSYSWMSEAEAEEALKHADEEHAKKEEKDEKPVQVRTAQEILWSLQVRDLTKRLMFVFQMEDKEALENWLLSEKVDDIRHAIKDLGDWPNYTPEKVQKKLFELVDKKRLVEILTQRQELKPVVVDILISDLLRVQKELRRESAQGDSAVRFCKSDHPLWTADNDPPWVCSLCQKGPKENQSDTHYRCAQCKIDVCKQCADDVKEARQKKKS